MIIVADSSALVALALSDGLELLDQLYQDMKKLILAVKPYLTKIQESKIFLSDNIVEEVLRLTNEG